MTNIRDEHVPKIDLKISRTFGSQLARAVAKPFVSGTKLDINASVKGSNQFLSSVKRPRALHVSLNLRNFTPFALRNYAKFVAPLKCTSNV